MSWTHVVTPINKGTLAFKGKDIPDFKKIIYFFIKKKTFLSIIIFSLFVNV